MQSTARSGSQHGFSWCGKRSDLAVLEAYSSLHAGQRSTGTARHGWFCMALLQESSLEQAEARFLTLKTAYEVSPHQWSPCVCPAQGYFETSGRCPRASQLAHFYVLYDAGTQRSSKTQAV